MAEYTCKVQRVKNDKTQNEFVLGDTVKDGDFPKEVIKHWLDTGVLERKKTRQPRKSKAKNK